MRRALRLVAVTALLGATMPAVAHAQGAPQPPGAAPARAQLEQQLRQRLWRIAKTRIGLTDDQMTKLEQSAARYDVRRRELNLKEREQRVLLRTELAAGERADQDRVAGAMDLLQQLQRQRLDLQADEQKDLSGFMTPVQRAKYAALQEQIRRRVAALQRQRAAKATRAAH